MILGAGIYQVPLIRTARRMGLYTIVVSIPGDYPGFALADKIYELNTRDKEAILAAAEKEQIDGICTSGTDVAVSTIGYICEKMHLSGIPYEAAKILTDKAKMKDAFRQGGVSAADGMRVRSAEEAQKAAEQLGFSAKGVKGDKEAFFSKFPLPCIAHVIVDGALLHYVVIHKITKKTVVIADPGEGIVKLTPEEFFGEVHDEGKPPKYQGAVSLSFL